MKLRVIAALSVAALIALALGVGAFFVGSGQAQFDNLPLDPGQLKITEAAVYKPDGDSPSGLRVTATLDVAALKPHRGQPLEVDVRLGEGLRKFYEVADAAIWRFDGQSSRTAHGTQPYYAQNQPDDVDARFLLVDLQQTNYAVEFFLYPREVELLPEKGLEFLKSADLRQRNFRVTTVDQK